MLHLCSGLGLASLLSMFPAGMTNTIEARGSDKTCAISGCSSGSSLIQLQSSPSVDIDNNWLKVNNKKYSRKRAHDAWLGRIGRTSDHWVAGQPVLVNFHAPAPEAWFVENVNISTTLALTSSQFRKIAAAVDFTVPTVGVSGDAGITSNSSHEASYVLRGLTFDDTWLIKRWLNDQDNREFMHDYLDLYSGLKKPRIVTTVWVLLSGEVETASSCTGGHLTLRYRGLQASAGASISGNGCTHSSWLFDPNTIIAYEASYLEFANNDREGRIRNIAADWYWTR